MKLANPGVCVFIGRDAARRLGMDVDLISGTGDVVLLPQVDEETAERSTLVGDGDWWRAWLVVARTLPGWVPWNVGAPTFPLNTDGWPWEWVCDCQPDSAVRCPSCTIQERIAS